MTTYVFEGVVTALSSISHNGGQSYGTTAMLRREKFVQPDGSVEEVPVVSGNSTRGLLRDVGMLHMCRALGYGENAQGLSLPAFHFLFSGGSLTSVGGKAIDIEEARRVRELIPLVGIFGGAKGNSLLPGKLSVNKMLPICSETAHLIPGRFIPEKVSTIWDYCQREMYTRKDDAKNEHKRTVIEPGARKLLEAAEVEKRAKNERNEVQTDTGQHQQMMYEVETLAAGTRFHWKITLTDVTDIEFEAFLTTLREWRRGGLRLGGKGGTGLGEVAVSFERWHKMDSRESLPESTEIDIPLGGRYAAHLRDRAEEIRGVLAAMRGA